MIYDRLENLTTYRGMSKWLDIAIDALADMDLAGMADGEYPIADRDVYCMVQSPALKIPADAKWETHERYIDIQIGLADGEGIGYAPREDIGDWAQYDAQKDATISKSLQEGITLPLARGMFAIFFPQDAHRPCLAMNGGKEGHKAVLKVRVE